MSNINNENLNKPQPISMSFEQSRTILNQMENCICKIYKNKEIKGTGFFCEIPFQKILLKVLITSNNILNEEEIDFNKTINIIIMYGKQKEEFKKIQIDEKRIKYTNKQLGISIIEIKPEKDRIINFLEIDTEFLEKDKVIIEENYKREKSYILHYIEEKLSVSYGLANDLKDLCSTGTPILSLENNEIIGINYKGPYNNLNNDVFINHIINDFKNNYYYSIYKNEIEIDLIYNNNNEYESIIFGDKFVEKNKNNVKLIINGFKSSLREKYILNKGDNNIKIILINKLIDLEDMFHGCESLKNIDGLKKLNTQDVINFKGMFHGFSSL